MTAAPKGFATGTHAALLVVRAFALPFLAEPHRSRIRELVQRCPALTARAWLARDPMFGAPPDVLTSLGGVFEETDDGSEETWLSAIRQLLEPDWNTAYADRTSANAVFDELRRAPAAELLGDYRRAARRLFQLGPRSTWGFCESVEQKTAYLRHGLREDVVRHLCDERPKRGRAPAEDRLVSAAATALGVSGERVAAVLALDAHDLAYRSAIHKAPFRRLALRQLLTAPTMTGKRP